MANQYDTNLKLQAIADAITGSGGVTPSLANLAKDTTLQATNTALGLLAKDNTAQATNTALGLLTKDTTLQATNTALGLLASDNSLQAIADDLETGSDLITALGAIATAITQGGGGGGTTNYNDLSNKPSINSTTLSGNKTGAELGLAGTADISNINITGSTNTTGSTIGKGVTFYLNGSLCVALANIAAGATFTSGTNYSTITIGEELSALNSKLAVETDTVGDVVFTKQGNIVSIYGYGITPTSLPTVPEKYRPNGTILFPVTAIASNKLYNAYVGITSAGAMNCNYSSTYAGAPGALMGGSIYFTVSYAV